MIEYKDYKELNNVTNLIDNIDSEMTRIYNKFLEFEDLIEKFTDTEDERFAATLKSIIRLYMREYNLLSIEFGRLVEKKQKILDPIINDLTKKEKKKTKFTYDDYLKLSKEERDNICGKEWHDLKPEDRMLIIEDWGFGDDIEGFEDII